MVNRQKRDKKRDAIILAAHTQFRLFGYRKTSMEDISHELGISRASLYSYFKNKDEIFRSVSLWLHERALSNAEECLAGEWSRGNVAAKIESALLARHLPFHDEQFQSPYAAELYDEYSRLCGDVVIESNTRFQGLLCTALVEALDSDLIAIDSKKLGAQQVAELLNLGVAGLKRAAPNPGVFEVRVGHFVNIFVSGLAHS